jgi:YD repeat-containing protein
MLLYDWQAGHLLASEKADSEKADVRRLFHIALLLCFAGSVSGNIPQWVDSATHSVFCAYDGAGNQITLTNRRSKQWQFWFDAANRLTNTITPMGRTNVTAFNDRGLVRAITNSLGQGTSFSYDARGRVTNRTDLVGTNAYQYDGNGNLTSITNVGRASSQSWGYDAYDRVSAFTN